MSVYDALPSDTKRAILHRLKVRKDTYLKLLAGKRLRTPKVLLIGDRPGPGAPTQEGYHHTPFYSVLNCSGWLNLKLQQAEIDEKDLVWINAYDRHGKPLPWQVLKQLPKDIYMFALGGNAKKWMFTALEELCDGRWKFRQTYHPQFWKRFHHNQPYPLIEDLQKILT